ncbi:hypothetical protein PLICRDRAFT_618859 [Plicaturopsis crispa FD-325 SS-3]|nr:hypothetical protein PLICRDRAFT_618859 [Plicaturopsis crispa FD-325 SS-3]
MYVWAVSLSLLPSRMRELLELEPPSGWVFPTPLAGQGGVQRTRTARSKRRSQPLPASQVDSSRRNRQNSLPASQHPDVRALTGPNDRSTQPATSRLDRDQTSLLGHPLRSTPLSLSAHTTAGPARGTWKRMLGHAGKPGLLGDAVFARTLFFSFPQSLCDSTSAILPPDRRRLPTGSLSLLSPFSHGSLSPSSSSFPVPPDYTHHQHLCQHVSARPVPHMRSPPPKDLSIEAEELHRGKPGGVCSGSQPPVP